MQGIAFELLQKSKKTCDKIRAGGENTIPNANRPQSPILKYGVEGGTD